MEVPILVIIFLLISFIYKPEQSLYNCEIKNSGFIEIKSAHFNMFRVYKKTMGAGEISLQYGANADEFDWEMSIKNPTMKKFELNRINVLVDFLRPKQTEVETKIGSEAFAIIETAKTINSVKVNPEKIAIIATVRHPDDMVGLLNKMEQALLSLRNYLIRK